MIHVGIFGATGYTGHQLVQLLARHAHVHIAFATSESDAGRTLAEVHPQAPPVRLIAAADANLAGLDVAFLCLPHGAAARTAVGLLERGVRVIDLSADFRLRDASVYEKWYGDAHPAPALLGEAVYGLTEHARAALREARLVANPGCYVTSVLLALQPVCAANAIAAGATLIADCKSGVSGAGRTPAQYLQFGEVANNFSAYKIGRSHRHLPEMEQLLTEWGAAVPRLIFSPHLLPVPRGILSTIYVPLAGGWDEGRVRALYAAAYVGEQFVQVLPAGALPALAQVNHSNMCVLGLAVVGETMIVVSALDNLIKGASGQAVQNMNVMFGLAEGAGLM